MAPSSSLRMRASRSARYPRRAAASACSWSACTVRSAASAAFVHTMSGLPARRGAASRPPRGAKGARVLRARPGGLAELLAKHLEARVGVGLLGALRRGPRRAARQREDALDLGPLGGGRQRLDARGGPDGHRERRPCRELRHGPPGVVGRIRAISRRRGSQGSLQDGVHVAEASRPGDALVPGLGEPVALGDEAADLLPAGLVFRPPQPNPVRSPSAREDAALFEPGVAEDGRIDGAQVDAAPGLRRHEERKELRFATGLADAVPADVAAHDETRSLWQLRADPGEPQPGSIQIGGHRTWIDDPRGRGEGERRGQGCAASHAARSVASWAGSSIEIMCPAVG